MTFNPEGRGENSTPEEKHEEMIVENDRSERLSGVFAGRRFIKEVLVTVGYSLFFYGITVFPGVFAVTESFLYPLVCLLLLLPAFIFIWVRTLENFFAFVFLHLIIGTVAIYAVFLISRNIDITQICGLLVSIEVIFSIAYLMTERRISLSGGFVLLTFILFLLVSYGVYKLTGILVDMPLSLLAVGVIACYLFYSHVNNIDEMLKTAEKSTIAPIESIITFNNKVVTLLISFMMLIILLSRFLFVDKLLLFLYSMLDKLLTFIFSFIRFSGLDTPVDEFVPERLIEEEYSVLPDISTQITGTGEIQGGASNTILYVIGVIILILIIVLIVADIYKKFKDLPKANEGKLLVPDVKTYVAGEDFSFFAKLRPMTQFFGMSNNEKVRRMFYKKVRHYNERQKVLFAKSETAGEMCGKIKEYENVGLLKPLYDKARYSDIAITDAELDNLKRKITNGEINDKTFDISKK